jgi:ubiquitin-like domain-containing CTD phosphatase 1
MTDTNMAAGAGAGAAASVTTSDGTVIVMVAKFGKEKYELPPLPPSTTILAVKEMLTERTGVLPKRQKLIGLAIKPGSGSKVGAGGPPDATKLEDLKPKGKQQKDTHASVITHQFILMGTPEEKIFVDPSERDDLPEVIDDFDLDFNAGSDEWLAHVANGENLAKFTENTECHIINPPREGKPLLVLDLDHTLLCFSSKALLQRAESFDDGQDHVARMQRPYMHEFLTSAYRHYDLVVWSQTSWRWLETKLVELGMINNSGYKFCFVLDKTSMFRITSTKRDGSKVQHYVKPLQIIWSKFPRWGRHNTVHIDDLERNFALNLTSGLKCTAYYRKKRKAQNDVELLGLARYLEMLAQDGRNFDEVDFKQWVEVCAGTKSIGETSSLSSSTSGGDKDDVKKKSSPS